jgi:mannonate dehydratase
MMKKGGLLKSNLFFISLIDTQQKQLMYTPIFLNGLLLHPYRADCVDALQQAHAEGARAIKWLPSAMGIDPLSKQCERFYKAVADLKLPIICHTGLEHAVQGGNQDFGNPLRVRRALDAGVKVVLAHCASDGDDVDLDRGANAQRVRSYNLFDRLMDESAYKPLLYADISAITLRNHA